MVVSAALVVNVVFLLLVYRNNSHYHYYNQPASVAEGPEGSEDFMRAMMVSAASSCMKLASGCAAFYAFLAVRYSIP